MLPESLETDLAAAIIELLKVFRRHLDLGAADLPYLRQHLIGNRWQITE